MNDLTGICYLDRAGRYANPANGNDRLPIVYGDLTDGTNGIWTLPCIDTTAFVYCFAGHPVLTVANGNSINIYADGALVNPSDYTFTASNDYESKGAIATIDFTADQANKVITARGKGKATGATLIENIIDIVYDYMTVENDFVSGDFEATRKAHSAQVFTAQAYKAAGVIDEDNRIDDTLSAMMGSFLGSWYKDGNGYLVLDIDVGLIGAQGFVDILPKSETVLVSARQRLANIINECPASYAYDYVTGEYRSHTDDAAHRNLISQGIFGVQEPASPYEMRWCRDMTSIQTMQDIIVERFGFPLWEIEVEDRTLKRIGLDVGDTVMYSAILKYDKNGEEMINQYWDVLSVRPDFGRGVSTFRLLQTQYYLTQAYPLDGSWKLDGQARI